MRKLHPKHLVVILVLINMLNYFDRYVVAAVLDLIGKDLHATDEQLGRLPFVFLVVYMLAAPFVGLLSEKMSRTKLVALGVGLWSLATAGAAFVATFDQLLMTRSLLGIGEAVYATLGPPILCDLYDEKDRASKFTWFYLAIPVGSALGFGIGGIVGGHYGWQASFLVAGLPGVLLAWWMWQQDDPQKGAHDSKEIRDADAHGKVTVIDKLKVVLTNRVWLMCTLSYVAYTFAMGALSHWTPTYFQRKFSVTPGHAGLVFGGIAVVAGILGTFLGGEVTKRYQDREPNIGLWVSLLTLLAAAPVVYFFLNADDINLSYGLLFVGMTFLFFNTSPVNAITVSCIPAFVRPVGTSLNVLFIHLFGDAISPELVGRQSTQGGGTADSLGSALGIVVFAIALSGLILFGAFTKRSSDSSPGAGKSAAA